MAPGAAPRHALPLLAAAGAGAAGGGRAGGAASCAAGDFDRRNKSYVDACGGAAANFGFGANTCGAGRKALWPALTVEEAQAICCNHSYAGFTFTASADVPGGRGSGCFKTNPDCGVKTSGGYDGYLWRAWTPAPTPAPTPMPPLPPPPPAPPLPPPGPAPAAEAAAAAELARRVVGASAGSFHMRLIARPASGRDRFVLPASAAGNVTILGTSGVALASGLRWYLHHVAGVTVAYGDVTVPPAAVPAAWPGVAADIDVESPVQWRYYMNVVTHSYAAAFWSWERWAKEVDWMALMGINLPLAFTGQEYVWDRVYRERFNLTEADMAAHFAGPAFLAWGRMGNIRGWGGWMDARDGVPATLGLTRNWMEQQADLQRKIVARERALGMTTVLPAFAGHVPLALGERGAKVSRSPGWCGFSDRYSKVGLLDPADPLFRQIGSALVEVLTEEFGTDHVYNGDTFNEMRPSSTDAAYVRSWGSAVYDALAAADPEATWFVQGWSLHSWSNEELSAYWSGVPVGRLLSLDLNCAQSGGSWGKYTHDVTPPRPVVCGLLDNMGGKRAIGGNLPVIAKQLLSNIGAAGSAGGTPLIAALGWNPEDLNQNPVKWHLLGEVGWRDAAHTITDMPAWLHGYAAARYAPHGGGAAIAAAWDALLQAAYQQSNHATSFAGDGLCRMPSLSLRSGVTKSVNASGIVAAARLLIAAAGAEPQLAGVSAFAYDLVDVVRQALQDRFADEYTALAAACGGGPSDPAACAAALNASGAAVLALAEDLDALLGTHAHFLLGRWIADARAWGATPGEKDWLEWNARVQVTGWGTMEGNRFTISDYAAKQWAGLVGSYYLPLWRHFLGRLADGATERAAVEEVRAQAEVWMNSTQPTFPTEPAGDAVATAGALLQKWFG